MTSLPSSWAQTKLGEVAQWGSGGTPSRSNASYFNGSIPWVKTGELGPRLLLTSEEHITPEAIAASSAKVFPKGSVILAMYGATIGKTSMLGIDAATNQACAVGMPLRGVLAPEFLLHYLTSQKAAFVAAGQGGAQPNISQSVVRQWPVPLPPLAEQKRIADKLDTVLARVDACRDRLTRVAPLLKRFRQAVLAAATSGRLTEDIDPAFEARLEVLANLGAVTGGLTKNAKRDELAMRRPYLRVANVQANELRLDEVSEIGLTEAEFAKTRLLPGDLLIVEGNGSIEQIGRVAIWSGEVADCSHQNHLIRWRAGERALPRFVLCFLLSPEGRRQIEAVASSTTGLHTLSVSKVGELRLPVPALALQTEIVRRVETLFAFADRLQARLAAAQNAVDRLTPSLLAKAFRGELVPQDPADEPAAELLARLRQRPADNARQVSPGPRRARRPAPLQDTP